MDRNTGSILDQVDLNNLSNNTNKILEKLDYQINQMESDYRKQVNYIYKEIDSIFKKEKNHGTFAKNFLI